MTKQIVENLQKKFGGFYISLYICGVKSVSVTIIIAYDYNIINIHLISWIFCTFVPRNF